MKVKTTFIDGNAEIQIFAENKWEERLLGASFEDGKMNVEVYRESHISYQDCKWVRLRKAQEK